MRSKLRPFPLQSILFIKLKIVKNIKDFNEIRSAFSQITFIPTMGNLHNGHLSLFERASKLNNPIFSSIFINPLQFNNKNDLKFAEKINFQFFTFQNFGKIHPKMSKFVEN